MFIDYGGTASPLLIFTWREIDNLAAEWRSAFDAKTADMNK